MSKANRKKKYEQYKGTDKLSDVLRAEFEPKTAAPVEEKKKVKK